ncbi:MAG: hypothetical protein E7296_05385 [Lachnospiraceae bacterium]|jgi:hypothetical protein|nr:hypothetical protein [Lachnospiraceae bacterium]
MRIYDLEPGREITILIMIGNQTMEFESEVIGGVPQKSMIYAKPVIKNNKVLTFNGKGISANVVITGKDTKPLIFRNAAFSTLKDKDGNLSYGIVSHGEGVEFNRRDSFRCPVDVPSVAQIGLEKKTYNIIIRDVSINGFSFCFTNDTVTAEVGQFVHTTLNDFIDGLFENFTFRLFGLIVREAELSNGKRVYGCKIVQQLKGIDTYIAKKERMRLLKQRAKANSRNGRERTT